MTDESDAGVGGLPDQRQFLLDLSRKYMAAAQDRRHHVFMDGEEDLKLCYAAAQIDTLEKALTTAQRTIEELRGAEVERVKSAQYDDDGNLIELWVRDNQCFVPEAKLLAAERERDEAREALRTWREGAVAGHDEVLPLRIQVADLTERLESTTQALGKTNLAAESLIRFAQEYGGEDALDEWDRLRPAPPRQRQ